MKQRNFCRYIVLSSACFASALGSNSTAASARDSQAKSHHHF